MTAPVPTGVATMRAWVQHAYGAPDALVAEEVPLPVPGPGQVRVRVAAASVNARDWHIMRGEPRVARLNRTIFGRTGPVVTVRGTDFAGTVDAVGAGTSRWRPGDRVLGEADGTFADFVVADDATIAAVPRGLGLEPAAALPLASVTALTLLRAAAPQAGERILVNGASGGVGTFLLQLARARGLHTTAVCSARNAALAQSLGADSTVDYATGDFCATTQRYSAVIDLVGNRSVRELRSLVAPAGTLVLSGGGVSGEGRIVGPLGLLVRAKLASVLPGPRIVIPEAHPTAALLEEVADLVDSGAVRPVLDRTFGFDQAPEAIRYLETEHARAKVVVTMAPDGGPR